jgi:hypothetical protein
VWKILVDETFGNQSATYDLKNTLRLRVANQFTDKYGKYIELPEVIFPYGQEATQAMIFILIKDFEQAGRVVVLTFTSLVSEIGSLSEPVRMACSDLYMRMQQIYYLITGQESDYVGKGNFVGQKRPNNHSPIHTLMMRQLKLN